MIVLEALPFDVLFDISTNLNLDDVVHLSQTCRQLRAILLNDTVSHQIVEAHHYYTGEAQQARQGAITYKEALCAIYDRRHAFSTAQPFSVRSVGPEPGRPFLANSFLYRQGVLCMQTGCIVRIINLRSATPAVQIDLQHLIEPTGADELVDSYEMMYYNDEILVVHVTYKNSDVQPSNIVCIRTANNLRDGERILGYVSLEDGSSKLFVRHTAQYLYFGTHTGEGSDGHRKWVINGCPMGSTKQGPYHLKFVSEEDNVLLEGFHGNDVGSTVAFEVHNGYFYAVSNQGTYEVEEVDWTSFYHCVRFPLDNPVPEAMQKDTRVYRRQHAEGAIHDSWTDLTLQHDERTNDLFIVESRREWIGASSQQTRTFYTSRINLSIPAFTDGSRDIDSPSNNIATLPDNDILTTVLESSHSANFMPTPKQYSWTRHPEFPSIMSLTPNPRSFILARTKFRAYNLSCSAFLDLVEDERCCLNRPSTSLPCLRLRIGSRRIAPHTFNPYGYEDGSTRAEYSLAPDGPRGERVHFADETQYRYTPIRMWPPPPSTCPCSARLHTIMNPVLRSTAGMGTGQKSITAICDERSIVYMIKPNPPYAYDIKDNGQRDEALGTLVLVDFGRPSTANTGRWSWDWTPGQEKRCRSGTCR